MNPRLWDVSFEDYFSKSLKRELIISLPPGTYCTRIVHINGKVWAAHQNKHQVVTYDILGKVCDTIALNNPRSVIQINNDILIASISGIYKYENQTCTQVIEGDFTDLCGYNGEVYCLEHNNNHTCPESISDEDEDDSVEDNQIVVLCKEVVAWKRKNVIKLQGDIARSTNDTVIVCPDQQQTTKSDQGFSIYVTLWGPNRTLKFDMNGAVLKEYGGYPNLSCPFLCGIDNKSNFLVANHGEVSTKFVDIVKGRDYKVTAMPPMPLKDGGRIYDILYERIDEQQCIWVLRFNKIVKYVTLQ